MVAFTEVVTWYKGNEPKKADWYLVAIRTNDTAERYYVQKMWFNPDTLEKWFAQGGCYLGGLSGSSSLVPYPHTDRITFFAHLPKAEFPARREQEDEEKEENWNRGSRVIFWEDGKLVEKST